MIGQCLGQIGVGVGLDQVRMEQPSRVPFIKPKPAQGSEGASASLDVYRCHREVSLPLYPCEALALPMPLPYPMTRPHTAYYMPPYTVLTAVKNASLQKSYHQSRISHEWYQSRVAL